MIKMVGRDLELTLGSCSLILLSIGACYIYKNINMEPKSTIPIPVSPVNLKITDTNNDDWWPFIEYTKFDTEDNMYNMWTKTRNN
jgi:hypothetical protein